MLVCKYGQNTSHPREAAVNSGGSPQMTDDENVDRRPGARGQKGGQGSVSAQALVRKLDKTIVLVGLMGAGKSCIGKRLAAKSRRRHEIVYQFLLAIGVEKTIAAIDAEGIEHHVSPETLQRFEKLTSQLGSAAQ